MRNFRREIETASELAIELAATEFSWSLTRHNLFRRCERAYFLHYYFAQGGWDPGADAVVKEAYAAKKRQSYESWLGNEVDRILKESLDRVRLVVPLLRPYRFRKELESRLVRLKRKALNISFYDFPLPEDDLVRRIDYDLRNSFRFFLGTSVPEILLKMQKSNRINRNMDYEFYEGDIRIWQNPGVMWQEPGSHCSFRVQYRSFAEEGARQMSDIFAYYCSRLFHESMSLSIFICQDGPDWQEFHFTGNPFLGRELVEASMDRMRKKIRRGNVVYIADFPECGLTEICSECRYRLTCSILREELE